MLVKINIEDDVMSYLEYLSEEDLSAIINRLLKLQISLRDTVKDSSSDFEKIANLIKEMKVVTVAENQPKQEPKPKPIPQVVKDVINKPSKDEPFSAEQKKKLKSKLFR